MKALMTSCSELVCAAAFLVALDGCSLTPKAAMAALTVTGFDMMKQEPTYVEGTRPRKMGLLVELGGETVGVWLTALTPEQTQVTVDTAKAFVGSAGQRSSDKQVLEGMTKSLGS